MFYVIIFAMCDNGYESALGHESPYTSSRYQHKFKIKENPMIVKQWK